MATRAGGATMAPPSPRIPACDKPTCRPPRGRDRTTLALPLLLSLLLHHLGFSQWAVTAQTDGFQEDSAAEKGALLAWKATLEGFDPDGALASWVPDFDPCEAWEGVQCQLGRVLALDLAGQRIRGTLPDGLSMLSHLRQIVVKFNALRGPALPPAWSSLERLVMIDATNNELEGSLRGGSAMPPRLNTLLLQNNRLSGSLPSQLGQLQYLALGSNQLKGTLPPSWAGSSGLMSLKLGDNNMRGTLPPEWSALGGLKFLELQNNALTGVLPVQWSTLGSMRFMELFNNFLDVEQLEALAPSLGGHDWVLLPQRDAEEAALRERLPADQHRLFSAAAPDASPKVVRPSGQIPYPAVVAILVATTAAISLGMIALLVWYAWRAVRSIEGRPLLMTNLEDACQDDGGDNAQACTSACSFARIECCSM
eukprot:jgi/Tetstr1/439483/TSEL_027915.t1